MSRTLTLLAAALLLAGTALATDRTDVLVPVHQFVDGFNKGDTKHAVAACAAETSIIDEFAPHEWHGAGACQKWADDYDANAKHDAITDGIVTLGTPTHVDVTGDHAYVVTPADYTFKQAGQPVKETGSMFTFALAKGADGWRITGWSWSKK